MQGNCINLRVATISFEAFVFVMFSGSELPVNDHFTYSLFLPNVAFIAIENTYKYDIIYSFT
jgi:hypothetical protein